MSTHAHIEAQIEAKCSQNNIAYVMSSNIFTIFFFAYISDYLKMLVRSGTE
jgi:hypothetical protein